MAATPPPSQIDPGWLGRAEIHALSYGLLVVGFVSALVVGRSGTIPIDSPPDEARLVLRSGHRINPNRAEWSELAALPGLGETLAKRIVAYRQARRTELSDPKATVFACPDDLEAVKGIGPKRAAALSSMLVFSDQAPPRLP